MPSGPLLSIVVVSYNRAAYLRLLLTSLLEQDGDEAFEVVLLDNGSDAPLESSVGDLLSRLPCPVTVLREEKNLLSPTRWQHAISSAQGDFILTPGDDDVLLPHYLGTMSSLARSGADVTMVSAAVQLIDSDGRRLGARITPPDYGSQPEALGRLLSRDDYPMPGSGFRRDAVDVKEAPLTRTAFDWWLWTQSWLAGRATVTESPAVLYRQHTGQEQRHYGTQSFRIDAARMMLDLVHSERFRMVVDGWTDDERQMFASTVLTSAGPNYGDTRWGPMVQIALVDILRGVVPSSTVIDLYAQAVAQAGSVASVGDLQAITGAPMDEPRLPLTTWSRVPISATWSPACAATAAWAHYLRLPEGGRSTIAAEFRCSCSVDPRGEHRLHVTLTRADTSSVVTLTVGDHPSDAAAAPLLGAIGSLTGRPHGFEVPNTTELKVLDSFVRFRASQPGVHLERLLRWMRGSRNTRRRSGRR